MEIPRFWRNQATRYRLQGEICPNGHKIFPPRDICPNCNQEAKTPYVFSGNGTVFSHTTIYEAPAGHTHEAPYTVALVKLDEGPMVTAQLTDLDEKARIGMPVEMVTRRLTDHDDERGVIVYGYKFRPKLSSS
jgi:hypothetical protein